MPRDKDPAHWRFLIFYYNPDDPRLFVPKRWTGNPFSLNFARRGAWVVLIIVLLVTIIAIPFLVQLQSRLHGF
jgi:uncharacterized membrane protein